MPSSKGKDLQSRIENTSYTRVSVKVSRIGIAGVRHVGYCVYCQMYCKGYFYCILVQRDIDKLVTPFQDWREV